MYKKQESGVLFKLGNVNFKKDKIFAFGSFILAIFFILYKDNERKKKFFELFDNKFFMISAFVSFLFSIYTLYFSGNDEESEKMKTATKHAIIAFLIGMLHHIDLKIGPFWFIWLASYYLDMGE